MRIDREHQGAVGIRQAASLYQDEPHRQQPPEDAGARGPFPELPHEVRHFGGVQTLCNGTRQPEFSQKMALK